MVCPAGICAGLSPEQLRWASPLGADGISKHRDSSFPERGGHICPQGLEQPQHPRVTRPGAPTASSLLHFSSKAELQPRSSSPDLRTGVIFRQMGLCLAPSAGKRRLGRQEGAGGWLPGALPARSHRGSFLRPQQKERPRGQGRAGQGAGGAEKLPEPPVRAQPGRCPAEATAVAGFCPRPLLAVVGGRGLAWGRAGRGHRGG